MRDLDFDLIVSDWGEDLDDRNQENRKNLKEIKKFLKATGLESFVYLGEPVPLKGANRKRVPIVIKKEMLQALEQVGHNSRGAGRKNNYIYLKSTGTNEQPYILRYADVVLLMQQNRTTAIGEMVSCPLPTFYRHLKKLKESDFYKKLSPVRMNDIEYLYTVEGSDTIF